MGMCFLAVDAARSSCSEDPLCAEEAMGASEEFRELDAENPFCTLGGVGSRSCIRE